VRTSTNQTLLLEESGPIVGILPDAQFSDTLVKIESGDILTFFTDGVTEQENENDEQFSMDRLRDCILRKENESAAALVADVTQAVFTFAGSEEQGDDLTLVIAKIL
jgi:sigma-B regulation protein RsbU (phosphoserine phosphatase)